MLVLKDTDNGQTKMVLRFRIIGKGFQWIWQGSYQDLDQDFLRMLDIQDFRELDDFFSGFGFVVVAGVKMHCY